MKRENMVVTFACVVVIVALYWWFQDTFAHAVLDTNWLVN